MPLVDTPGLPARKRAAALPRHLAVPSLSLAHVPGIDGLRALAVLAVMLFHLDEHWLPNGFAGVDVFFVISGFVVSASVGRAPASVQGGRAFVAWFYRRRFLRILPAAMVFVLLAALFTALFVPQSPSRLASGTASLAAFFDVTDSEPARWLTMVDAAGLGALFGVANWVLYGTGQDYFSTSASFWMYGHTWSLGVEEQFYLLFPLLVCCCRPRALSVAGRAGLVIALTILAAISFLASLAWTVSDERFAFYMLPSRAWELALGVLLFHALTSSPGQRLQAVAARHADAAGWLAALLGLYVSVYGIGPWEFPGPGALPVCLATAALIVAVVSGPHGAVQRLLSCRGLQQVGRLSYSLYLWHWGVMVALRWTVGMTTQTQKCAALLLTFGLAWASWRWVELPCRRNRRLMALPPHLFFLAALAALSCSAAILAGLNLAKPWFSLSVTTQAALWSPYEVPAASMLKCPVARRIEALPAGTRIDLIPQPCMTPSPLQGRRLFVIGDSHADAYRRALHRLASDTGVTVTIHTQGDCKFLLSSASRRPWTCADFIAKSKAAVLRAARPGDVVFLAGLYLPRPSSLWEDGPLSASGVSEPIDGDALAVQASIADLEAFTHAGVSTLLEGPKPVLCSAMFRCADWFNRDHPHCLRRPQGWMEFLALSSRPTAQLRAVAAGTTGAALWDPAPLLCPHGVCRGDMQGQPLFFDTDHLSGFGNDWLYADFKRAVTSLFDKPSTSVARP